MIGIVAYLRSLGLELRLDSAPDKTSRVLFRPNTPDNAALVAESRAAIVADLEAEGALHKTVETVEAQACVAQSPTHPELATLVPTTAGDVATWIADVERETGARIEWDGKRVRIVPELASGYVPPWLCSEAWQVTETARNDDVLRAALEAAERNPG